MRTIIGTAPTPGSRIPQKLRAIRKQKRVLKKLDKCCTIRSNEEATTTIRPLSSRSSGLLIIVASLPCGTRSARRLRRHRGTKMWWQRRGGCPASRGLARRNGIRHCPRRRLLLLLLRLLRVEERSVRSGDRRGRRRLLPMSLVLLIVVPRAVAVVLLLLADVGLC